MKSEVDQRLIKMGVFSRAKIKHGIKLVGSSADS